MRRLLRVLAAALMVLTMGVLFTDSAHADDEYVRSLDVQFDLRTDGSMDVRYEIDWHFGEKGRHGIIFSIVTRENWDPDPTQDAVYRVENLNVSSPSGAPASYTTDTSGYGSDESLEVRIGDPAVTLDTEDATYVITYRIHDVMREFDGIPELQWDVINNDYPPIENFQVRLTAPEGVDAVGCETGSSECDAHMIDRDGVFSGTDITRATTIYAQLPVGSITNTQPQLEHRRLGSPELLEATNELTVDSDGVVHARHELSYEVPADSERSSLRFSLATRLPWSDDHDHVLEYRNFSVHDKHGAQVSVEPSDQYGEGSTQEQEHRARLQYTEGDIYQTLVITYEVEGAIGVSGDTAALRLPFSVTDLYREPSTTTLKLPSDVTAVRCLDSSRINGLAECRRPVEHTLDAGTVTFSTQGDLWMFPTIVSPEFDASSLTGELPPLQPSYDKMRDQYRALGWAAGVGGAGLLVAVGKMVGRFGGGFDKRFAQVAPGLVDPGGPVRRAKRTDEIPVEFSPPSVPLHLAGLLRDRSFRPTHLAAELVQLAVLGAVELKSKPLTVVEVDDSMELTTVQRSLLRWSSSKDRPLSDRSARRMRTVITDSQDTQGIAQNWLQPDSDVKRMIAIVGVIGALALAGLFWLSSWNDVVSDMATPARVLIIIGAVVAIVLALRQRQRVPLQPDGRAMLDQVDGFHTYLATAEAEQLAYEADHDIFRRYLPWAVLFGLTERWTRVCQDLANQGRIATPDFAFVAGAASVSEFTHSIDSFTSGIGSASTPVSSSSSGSGGGSSGFSGGGFSGGGGGGGGGGGTGASSW